MNGAVELPAAQVHGVAAAVEKLDPLLAGLGEGDCGHQERRHHRLGPEGDVADLGGEYYFATHEEALAFTKELIDLMQG